MTPEQTAQATASAISALGSHFMLDPATYVAGGGLGFEGMDFYIAGRGGVLGDVDADVVTAALVFFNPNRVRAAWEVSAKVMPRQEAARHWAAMCHAWGTAHLPADLDCARLAELAGAVVAQASPACAPLFAGWRSLAEPDESPALAIHRLNALRELRGAIHGASVVAGELTPREALQIRQPYMAEIFGWSEPHPEVADKQSAWEASEAATDRTFGRAFAVLDEQQRSELADLVNAAHEATA